MLLAATQQTAACNSLHDAEQRLARWLLQAQDLVGEGETIPFTQEFLSHMLGVRRTTVTLVAGLLQSARVIQYRRGRIEILDRAALERASCECYSVIHTLAQRSAPVPKNRKP
jgi:CRP-like cAMP-binding protein